MNPLTAVASIPGYAGTRHGRDDPIYRDLADTVVQGVGNVDIACRIHHGVLWSVQGSRDSWNPITKESRGPIADDGVDGPCRREHAYSVVVFVCNKQLACRVERQTRGSIERGRDSRTSIPEVSGWSSVTDDSADRCPDHGPANTMVEAVRKQDLARGIDNQSPGIVE